MSHEVSWEELLLQYCPINPHAPHRKSAIGKENINTFAILRIVLNTAMYLVWLHGPVDRHQ